MRLPKLILAFRSGDCPECGGGHTVHSGNVGGHAVTCSLKPETVMLKAMEHQYDKGYAEAIIFTAEGELGNMQHALNLLDRGELVDQRKQIDAHIRKWQSVLRGANAVLANLDREGDSDDGNSDEKAPEG